jgi:hypothetical protein
MERFEEKSDPGEGRDAMERLGFGYLGEAHETAECRRMVFALL